MHRSRLLRRWLARGTDGLPAHTARLVLRSAQMADVPEMVRMAGEWEVASMTARIPYPYTQDDARQWLSNLDPGELVLVVEHEGQMVGAIGYVPDADGSAAEIGYWIGRPYWGRGYATEAAREMIEIAFSDRRVERLYCCHFTENHASARVIEKLGFVRSHAGMAWSDARRVELSCVYYEMKRPAVIAWPRRASRGRRAQIDC